MSRTFSCKDVSRLFKIPESRLRYWDRTAFLSPSGHEGRTRCYTFQDLVAIRTVKTLLDQGVTVQKARRVLQKLKESIPRSPHPLGKLRVVADSNDVVVVADDHEYEADTGQLLIDFRVSAIEQHVVAELPQYREQKQKRTAYEWYLEGCRLDESESTFRQAEEAYLKAIHMDPGLSNAYTNLGNLLYRLGRAKDAMALYVKATEIDPDQPEAQYNLGFIEFEHGELQSAMERFSRAVDIDPSFADAHFNLAMTLHKLGKSDTARGHWRCYLNIEPEGPWADIARERLRELG